MHCGIPTDDGFFFCRLYLDLYPWHTLQKPAPENWRRFLERLSYKWYDLVPDFSGARFWSRIEHVLFRDRIGRPRDQNTDLWMVSVQCCCWFLAPEILQLAWKTGARNRRQFLAPVSGACVISIREPQVLEGTRLIIQFTPRQEVLWQPHHYIRDYTDHQPLGVTDFLTFSARLVGYSVCRLAFHEKISTSGSRLVGTTYFCLRGVLFRGEIVH